jgi:type IV pilus assembly protein PilY1
LDTAYGYQADAITGAVKCGDPGSATYLATSRSTSRATYVAPQPPAPVISVNAKSGQVTYGSVTLDPGSPPSGSTVGANDLVAPVHWLEVPREVHDCRHGGTNCN